MEKQIFEALGIDQEELIERTIDRILGMTAGYKQTGEDRWEDIPFSAVVDARITKALGNLVEAMKEGLQERINAIMTAKIEEIFIQPFQPIDRWGKAVGEITTINDLIATEAQNYWSTKVEARTGKPSNDNYSDREERAIYYAKKVMTEFYDKELKSAVDAIAKDLRSKIPKTIGDEIAKTVINRLY